MKLLLILSLTIFAADTIQIEFEVLKKPLPKIHPTISKIIYNIANDLEFKTLMEDHISQGGSVNDYGEFDPSMKSLVTPIFMALNVGKIDDYHYLRSKGAKLDLQSDAGFFPHTYACSIISKKVPNIQIREILKALHLDLLAGGIILDPMGTPSLGPREVMGSSAEGFVGEFAHLLDDGLEYALVRPFWNAIYGASSNQVNFERNSREIVEQMVSSFDYINPSRLEDIFNELSVQRQNLAFRYEHMGKNNMGRRRNVPLSTSISDQYFEYIFDRQASLTEIFGKDIFNGNSSEEDSVKYQVEGTLRTPESNGEVKILNYYLTGIAFDMNNLRNTGKVNKFRHTHPDFFNKNKEHGHVFWKSMEDILSETLVLNAQGKLTEDILIRNGARLYWWFSQMTVALRGSASITNMLVRSYFKIFGKNLSPWKPFLIPDIEALIRNENQFLEIFPNLFRGTVLK